MKNPYKIEKMDPDWFLQGHLDYEFQTYRFLSYVQKIKENFQNYKLYPELLDMLYTYESYINMRENIEYIQERIKLIKELDSENTNAAVDNDIKIVLDLIEFSSPLLKELIKEGLEIEKSIENDITYSFIGILPPSSHGKKEGFAVITYENICEALLYSFSYTIKSIWKQINTLKFTFLENFGNFSGLNVPFIKDYIVSKYKEIPNPFVISFHIKRQYPLKEAIEPIVQKIIISIVERETLDDYIED